MRLLFVKRGYAPIGGSESLAFQFATRLAAPLREMVRRGELQPLAKDAVAVQWVSLSAVRIYMKVRPPNAPKDIQVAIALDTTTEG